MIQRFTQGVSRKEWGPASWKSGNWSILCPWWKPAALPGRQKNNMSASRVLRIPSASWRKIWAFDLFDRSQKKALLTDEGSCFIQGHANCCMTFRTP